MKLHHSILFGLAFFATTVPADAQLLPRWFGPKTPDKSPAAQPDPRRVTEVNVEIAWLADPATFPYYLEAHATVANLEVRGYVPNKAVREQALRIAQVYSSLPVTDAMKEHPSLLVRPTPMSPKQLQTSVQSSLRTALPKQYQQLKTECGGDGKVYVVGTVNTYEEKMAVSHALRRLHGCTSVQNLTSLPGEMAQGSPRDKTPVVNASNSSGKPVVMVEEKAKPWWAFSNVSRTSTEEPPLLEQTKGPAIVEKTPQGPILIPNVPELKKPPEVVKADPPSPAPLSAAELQKRIQKAFPQVKSVEVQFTSATEVRITIELASENELKSTAERAFALPELQNLRAELQFKISAP